MWGNNIVKFFIRIAVIFILALAVAGFSHFTIGQVTIYISNYRYSFSLNLLIVFWLLTFAIIYYLTRLYINVMRLPNKIQRSRIKNALIISRRHLNYAGLHYFEGKYRSCYNDAMKSVKKEYSQDNKFLAYLLAFRAASIMRDSQKENEILSEIDQFKDNKWQLAKHMVIADNLYNEQQFGLCIDNLNAVLQIDHKHVPAHRMLLKVYLHLANFHKAYEMLTWLLKNDSLREYKASKYKAKVIGGLFSSTNDVEELTSVYNKLDKTEKSSFLFGKQYFDAMLRLKEYDLAIQFLETHLKDESLQLIYSESLLALSKRLESKERADRLLVVAEKCLKANPNSSQLLLALGILSYTKQLWGKSQNYLEASINIKPSLDGFLYLSLVAKANNDNDTFNRYQNKLLNNLHNLI